METPSLSKLLRPRPKIEQTRTIERIGITANGEYGPYEWTAIFVGSPEIVVLNASGLDRTVRLHLALSKPGDRLRTEHKGNSLTLVENLDLTKASR